jgi:hypothetical protein
VATEVATFVALAVLGGVARWRGWSEVNGLMDGVVYGTAAGLGTATGTTFILELLVTAPPVGRPASGAVTLAAVALTGLSQGLFGSLMGAGFGVAVRLDSPARRFAAVAAGLAAAVLAHAAYLLLAWGNSLDGAQGRLRALLALLLPLAFVAATALVTLRREAAILRHELAEEAKAGVVTEEELDLAARTGARRSRDLRALLGGDFDGWFDRRIRHHRLAQLALAKARAGTAPPQLRPRVEAEANRLRAALRAGRPHGLPGGWRRRDQDGGAAMTDRCGRCGADLPSGSAFCPACGQRVGSAPAARSQAAPQVTQPSVAQSPPALQPPADAAGGLVDPPRALSGRSTAILLGGMALVFVLALVVVLSGPGGPPVPTTSTFAGSQPTPSSSSPPNQPGPANGPLRSQVEQQVGPFQLRVLKPAANLLGANERLQAVYRSARGVEVQLEVAAYPSAADAEQDRQAWKRLLTDKGIKQVEENPVRSTSGAQLGTMSVHQGQVEFVAWTDINLSVLTYGPIGQTVTFYNYSTY